MAFRPNPRFAAELRADPEFQAGFRAVVENDVKPVVDAAVRQAEAPWMRRQGAPETIALEQEPEEIRVVNTDHAGHLMEFGSANNPPHAPLRRGVQAAGLRLEEQAPE